MSYRPLPGLVGACLLISLRADPGFPPGWSATADATTVVLKNPQPGWVTRVLTADPDRNTLSFTREGEVLFTLGEVAPLPGVPGREPGVRPRSNARRRQLRLAPSGSGSLSLHRNTHARVDNGEAVEGARTWWTVGSDASGASGSPGLWVIVCGQDGFGLRPIHLPLTLHRLEGVTVEDNRFQGRVPGTDLFLRGTVLFPEGAHISQTRTGENKDDVELRLWLRQPDEGNIFTWSDAGALSDLTLEDPEDGQEDPESPNVSAHIRRVIRAVSTSTAMGAPGLNRRVNQHMVVVLTLSAQPPPQPVPGDAEDQVLFRMGEQSVRYWEHLVEFETGMRDLLAPAQGRIAP